MLYNMLLDTDSYKFSHWKQYPPKTTNAFFYLESRGGRYCETVFFGLQYILKEYLSKPVTAEMVEEAKAFAEAHGEPFNYDGWMDVVTRLKGKIPVKIKAVKEGTVVPTHNVLMTVESTDEKAFWVASFIETLLMRIWYPITVATQSWHIKQIIKGYLDRTSENPDVEISFKLHDFGARGVSSMESSGIGGMSHLVNFMGSDTVMGVAFANRYYDSKMAAFSIPAAEHSTITSWGRENEVEAYRNMLKQFASKDKLVAIVSDSYDLSNAVLNLWGKELKQEVIDSGATVIIRPDSGHPASIVLRTLKELESRFGSSYNKKGYRVLNYVRVIQGDGINEESIREILETIAKDGFSATNVAFGMGGALLQKLDRDTQKFAYKCSEVTINGKSTPVFKCPADDKGKTSKKGRLDLVIKNGKYETVQGPTYGSVLETVFEDGKILKTYTLDEVRATSKG